MTGRDDKMPSVLVVHFYLPGNFRKWSDGTTSCHPSSSWLRTDGLPLCEHCFWLLDTTVINAYIIGYGLYGKHRPYKTHLQWKWHVDLAKSLYRKDFMNLIPTVPKSKHPILTHRAPLKLVLELTHPATQAILLGNTKNSCQHGYVSKYYELPLCRKQLGRHILKHMGKERLCVFCRYLKSSLTSSEACTCLLSHPQAPRFNKTR